MNEILQKLVELVKFVEKFSREVASKKAALDAQEAILTAADGEIKKKDQALRIREEAVSTIENVALIRKQNSDKEKELTEIRNKFEQDKRDFERYRTEQSNVIKLSHNANKVEADRLASLEKSMEADVKNRVMDVLKNAKVNLVAPELEKI